MNGLYITVDGVVGTDPRRFVWNGDPIISFRLVAKERKYDKSRGGWVDGHSSWMTVSCFRALAKNVDECVRKGDRLIVHGRVRVKDHVTDTGAVRTIVDLEADSVGHNLTFGTARFRPAKSAESAQDQIRAQADELARGLAEEPVEDVEVLIAQRLAEAEAEPEYDHPDDDPDDDEPDDGLDDDEDVDESGDAEPGDEASVASAADLVESALGAVEAEPGPNGRAARRGSRKVLAGVAG
jgi:single-strand DNA-binding protein